MSTGRSPGRGGRLRPCLILQSDVGWPLSLGRGKRGGEAVGEVWALWGMERRGRGLAVPSGSSAWGVGGLWSSQGPRPLHLRREGPCRAPEDHACGGLRCADCYGARPWVLGSASVHRAGDPGWLSSKFPFRARRWQWMARHRRI